MLVTNNSEHTVVQAQRDYYAQTAERFDEAHCIATTNEHDRALSAFVGLAETFGPVNSVLDVGAGTGRAMMKLKGKWPHANIMGVEPVSEMREIGYNKGISAENLVGGDALNLKFADNSFDWVIETATLHHIPTPLRAVEEMVRVARTGVMLSDSNNVGQGPALNRNIKYVLNVLGLWPPLEWVRTRGKMYRYDNDDGVSYFFSVLSCVDAIKKKFPRFHYMNTANCIGFDLYRGASHVMVLAAR